MASFPSFTKAYHKTAQPYTSPTQSRNSAAGKTVLVTGGGRGIGFQIATAFVQAGAAHVVILGRSEATLEQAKRELEQQASASSSASAASASSASSSVLSATTKIHAFSADISSPEAATSAFAAATAATAAATGNKKRGIDICIANAGYSPDALEPATRQPLDQFWRAYEVNVKGVLNVMAAFLAHSSLSLSKSHGSGTSEKEKEKEKKEGEEENLPVLIAINTGMAHLPYFGPFAAYASSKAAAAKLLEYVQVEEAGRVRMHNLQPGIIRTEMGSKADVPAEVYDDILLPAHFCVWLASQEAAFLSGRFVWANWDAAELKEREEEIRRDENLFTLTLGGWPFGRG